MKTPPHLFSGKTLACFSLLAAVLSLSAATVRYVNVNSTNPVPPFTDWSTPATIIQDAVDAAVDGDEIVVTNGIYQTGAREVYGMSNRVAVTKPLTVQSINGPAVTQIVGSRPSALRCVYLTSGAVLAGFTLTNGGTQTTTGDWRTNRSGGGVWCEGLSSVVSNCVLTGNSAHSDGGVSGGTLNNCVLTSNSADSFGGGANSSTLNDCTLTNNTAFNYGGGAAKGTLNNCTLTGNSGYNGGGAHEGTLNNCTLTSNSASWRGGGAFGGRLNNCIAYYNSALDRGANYEACSLNFCCTTPLPSGLGNRIDEPQLANGWRLSTGSPCRGRGSAAYVSGVDVDGEPWTNPPSIGCYEYWRESLTGALSVTVVAAYTQVAVGFGVDFQAVIGGRLSASCWDFGDGIVVSNRPWASHAWAAAGDYVVELRAYNESNPAGVATTVIVHVVQEEHYVALTNANPLPPYSSWATAATNIQVPMKTPCCARDASLSLTTARSNGTLVCWFGSMAEQ